MHATSDGFTHQSRQDDAFDLFECFAQAVCLNLQLASQKRPLNEDESNIMQLAAELIGWNGSTFKENRTH
jgi:hypothetical protein